MGVVLLAYFFVPLPEPLGLPDGFIFEFTRSLTYEEWLEMEREEHRSQDELDAPVLLASLRFWRATAADVNEFSLLFDTAQRSLPTLPSSTDNGQPPLPHDRTIVEMVVPVSDDDREEGFGEAFDRGLECLREFQRAYYLVGGYYPITLATRERMPFGVPMALRHVTSDGDVWPTGLNIILLNQNLQRDTRLPDLTDEQLKGISGAVGGVERRQVFAVYSEFVRESRLALDRDGDYRAAVVFSATAAEVLLDDLLSHMMWEDGFRPEEGAAVFDKGFLLTRVRSEYHSRIGGDWGPTSSAVERWRIATAAVRHRVVHAGHEPGLEAARDAVAATGALEKFIVTRLIDTKSVKRYPRTALKLLGEPGLRRCDRWSRHIEQLTTDTSEPHWDSTFFRWRETMNRVRKEGRDLAPKPGAAESVVVLVLRPSGRYYFAVHDRQAAMAGAIGEPPDLPSPHAEQVAMALARLTEEPPEEYQSIALMDLVPWEMPQDWRPQYRVLPLAGVMLNRQDIDDDLGA